MTKTKTRTPRQRYKDFQLGIGREELKEVSQFFGMKKETASRASSKRLESFLLNKFVGRGAKMPKFDSRSKRDIARTFESFGIEEGAKYVMYKVGKTLGTSNENSFLRLTLASAFRLYYSGIISNKILDELEKRIPSVEYGVIISGLIDHKYEYQNLLEEYAEELELEEMKGTIS